MPFILGELTSVSAVPSDFPVLRNRNNPSVQLASNIAASGPTAAAVGLGAGSYVWSAIAANWNGATASLQSLGPDGSTWVTIDTLTANGTKGVVIGENAVVRISLSAAPAGFYSSLS